MAFEGLSEKLQNVFKGLKGKGSLTEADINAAMREVEAGSARGGCKLQGRKGIRRQRETEIAGRRSYGESDPGSAGDQDRKR